MKTQNSSNKAWLGAGIFAAIAASLCCITPLLAILGGIGGVASAFSWLEPLRPYLIGLTVIALGTAFYQAYKPSKADIDCDCEDEQTGKKKVLLTKLR